MNKVNLTASVLLMGAFTACQPATKKETEKKAEEKPFPAFDLANLDTTVAPCTDFFQYTTGGFNANNPIPESESRWGQFNILMEANNKKLKGIFEEFSGKADLPKGSTEQLVGDLYYSGMDTAHIEKLGLTNLQPTLDKINAIASLDDYFALAAEMELHGIQIPFGLYVSPDQMNSTMNVLYAAQSGTSLPDRDYYLKDDSMSVAIQDAYKVYVAKMFELAGDDAEASKAKAEAVYNLEYKLAENQMSRVERRNPANTYNKMAFSELVASAPGINWDVYTKGLGVKSDTIIVGQPDFYKYLSTWFGEVSLEDLKAYTRFKTLSSYADQLPAAYEQAQFDFYGKMLSGTEQMKPRWKRTLGNMGGLGEQIGHLFVDQYFPAESKEKVAQMVEDLRAAYRDRINTLSWMSEETKVKALEKLDGFSYKIGYPNKWEDLSSLEISRDNYLQNIMNIAEYRSHENYEKLGKEVDKDEWHMGAHIVNAYYNPLNNEIVFPAGILQPPFYNPNADDAINYGGIGGVIGHEFTHGFDDQGSKYDVNGNLNNWWTEEDKANFDVLVKQVIDQYSAYEPLEGVHVNGALTVGENIADFGGITLAYYAYQKSREGKPALEPIDGYTDEQRVFLGWAQVWQSSQKDAAMRNQIMTNPHSPAPCRVNGPISNMTEFEKAYNCEGDETFMRPDSAKIVIW